MKEEIEVHVQFLKEFTFFVLNHCNDNTDKYSNFWDHVKYVANKVAGCCHLLRIHDAFDGAMGADFIGNMLLDLLQSLKPTKSGVAKVYIGVLKAIKSEIEYTHALDVLAVRFVDLLLHDLILKLKLNSKEYLLYYRDPVYQLHKALRFLLEFIFCKKPQHTQQLGDVNQCFTIFEDVYNKLGSLINSLADGDDMNEDPDHVISNFLRIMKPITSQIRQIYLKVPKPVQSLFPKTNCLGFIDSVSHNFLGLLDSKRCSSGWMRCEVETLLEKVKSFKPFLSRYADQQGECMNMSNIHVWNHTISLTYKVEYIVDMVVVEPCSVWDHLLEDLKDEIDLFTEYAGVMRNNLIEGNVPSDSGTSSKASTPFLDEPVVGLEDEIENLVARLTGGSTNLETIPIIGMPGIGKTTLAKGIYNDSRIRRHFDVRAWCFVSTRYDVKELLQDIYISMGDHPADDGDLPTLVRKRLYGKRYLIVLDNVWMFEGTTSDELLMCFPDNGDGSRILLTSSLTHIGEHYPCVREPFIIHLLTEEKSWELLQARFNYLCSITKNEGPKPPIPNKNCPAQVGEEIAINCQGLPLAIVLVAAILFHTEGEKDCLTDVKEALSSPDDRDVGDCMAIIELSYKNMPSYLRQCFLYFAAFSKSTEIPVSQLTWLWVSEGFVQKDDESMELEDVAEHMIDDLMRRSLVMVAEVRSKGGAKSCRVHDLLHDFCSLKCTTECFLPSLPIFHRRIGNNGEDENASPFVTRTFLKDHYVSLFPSGGSWRDVSIICSRFKLLRVLDLEHINLRNSFPWEIEMLVHLRYLSLHFDDVSYISSFIQQFRSLETFIVKGTTRSMITLLPNTLYSMESLRHFHINNCTSSGFNFPRVKSLQTLSTVSLSDESLFMMGGLSSLRKLKCKLTDLINRISFESLNQLESLKVIYQGMRHLDEFDFPSNLKKLTLSMNQFPMSNVGTLANLEVLKLYSESLDDWSWDVTDEEFPKLKFMKLVNLKISNWDSSDDAFPSLEHIVLQNCKNPTQIPSSLGNNYFLNKIEVLWCDDSVARSARKIEEIQHEEIGNYEFNLSIQNPNMD